MILVKRDVALIPDKILKVAERAQKELEAMAEPERKAFIKKKSHIWRTFGQYLAKMSYGKCWYSESPDPHSFFDVDHFRPKLEAKRSETDSDVQGYEWLAFDWDNFRYAANCANRVSQNIETGNVEGKGSWFPLLENSAKAEWGNRCIPDERPVLIDPVAENEVRLMDVDADGFLRPSKLAVGSEIHRVERSCELYGLNLPRLRSARQRLMREIQGELDDLLRDISAVGKNAITATAVDAMAFSNRRNRIRDRTRPESPYSAAARAAVVGLGCPELCA